MKCLLISFCLAVTAFAYPDVSELTGYNYNPPSGGSNIGSAAEPSGSYLPGSGSNIADAAVNTPSGSYIPPSGSNILGSISAPSGSYIPGGIGSGSGIYPNAIQEQKHVYFYAAPDDEAPARFRINVAPSNKKNTKVIFIKAPGGAGIIPEIINPPSQAEDKTLVYVLVKKNNQHGQQITIPASLGVKQAKPEVYFIKYRNPQDAERILSEGLAEHPAGSSLPALSDAQALLRTIKDGPQNGFGDNLGGGSSILGAGVPGSNGGLGSSGSDNSGSGYNYGPAGGSGPY